MKLTTYYTMLERPKKNFIEYPDIKCSRNRKNKCKLGKENIIEKIEFCRGKVSISTDKNVRKQYAFLFQMKSIHCKIV